MKTETMDAKELFSDFLKDKLQNNIELLKDYDFAQLKGDKKYGCPGRNFDCDDTNLAKSIYVLIWGDNFPGLSMETVGSGKKYSYRGDTMNSFNTMFGEHFESMHIYNFPNDLKDHVIEFHKKYHTIGNFTVLPNKEFEGKTFNRYRGTSKLHDYFDQFLIELDKVFRNASDQNSNFSGLKDMNKNAWKEYSSVKDLAATCFWNDYLNEQGNPDSKFRNVSYGMKLEQEEYFGAVRIYLTEATQIIDARAEKMIAVLKEKIDA